jgi:hypothetical protein
MNCMTQRDPFEPVHKGQLANAFLFRSRLFDQRRRISGAGIEAEGWRRDRAAILLSGGVAPVVALTGSREPRQ